LLHSLEPAVAFIGRDFVFEEARDDSVEVSGCEDRGGKRGVRLCLDFANDSGDVGC
jgi:hypothetical protein